MKCFRFFICLAVALLPFTMSGSAENEQVYGSYSVDNLTLTSYSTKWNDEKLKKLSEELKNNFTSDEYGLLASIVIYPNSPTGYNGEYFEDISIKNGEYVIGGNAKINLYNGDRYDSIEKIAPIVSHEYGHHYTAVNILKSEGRYSNDWQNSTYAKLRKLSEYDKVCIDSSDENYSYRWDITELAANDYYELLGSDTGKTSLDYPDTEEQLEIDEYVRKNPSYQTEYDFSKTAYNAMPQKNLDLPLAADVDGLYEYFLQLGGYTDKNQGLTKYPRLSDISYSDTEVGRQYKVTWTEAYGSAPFEYTLIMYGKNSSVIPIPIKTVTSGEELCATFGSGTNGIDTIQKQYNGEYEFVIFIRDVNGFIYSTTPVKYDFSSAESVTTYINYPLPDGTLNDVFNAVIQILKKEEANRMKME